MRAPSAGSRRLLLSFLATAVVLSPLLWMWQQSRLPAEYSVMQMGHAVHGGVVGHASHTELASGASIETLTADPNRPADVAVDLVARAERFTLASGREVDGFTLNGQSPGPSIRAVQGQLVEVRLENADVAGGVALHWHGLDVPNAMDGVAGVTQDAVLPGSSFTYRFVADQVGTYWYHSHQLSHDQVKRGLLGALVVTPPEVDHDLLDVTALVHLYDGRRTVNGEDGGIDVAADPGARVRVRIINTDNGPMSVWAQGSGYRVLAVDGTDVREPELVEDRAILVTAGGRADLGFEMPADGSGIRIELGGSATVTLGAGTTKADQPEDVVDLLSYGAPAPPAFDATKPDRTFEYSIGRRPGFVEGRPGLWWTINGHMFPDVPMFHVAEGDVVRVRISNSSGQVHPMHLHGHHVLVLSRNGEPATGSPWWVDSLNVADGESYEVAFLADNPGVWMDHCHNLPHAAEGLVAHLAYDGVFTPFMIGGPRANEPE
jgi:FtsP/CotA-like multicopper oxidase with cupredoxin domain